MKAYGIEYSITAAKPSFDYIGIFERRRVEVEIFAVQELLEVEILEQVWIFDVVVEG